MNQNPTKKRVQAAEDFLQAATAQPDNTRIATAKKETTPFLRQRESRMATDYITGTPEQRKKINGIAVFNRIAEMPDDEFDRAVKSGELTPEQIRAAGEYFHDVWMGDVWAEGEHDDEPEPSYEEFYADPAKYGYSEDDNEYKLYRYKNR